MKDFLIPMKIPQKWGCQLEMSYVLGQQAFYSENYATKSTVAITGIVLQKSKVGGWYCNQIMEGLL